MLIAMAFGVAFWIADGVYEYFFFSENLRFMLFHEPMSFVDSLLLDVPPHALWTRLVFLAACLVGGLLVAMAMNRYRRASNALLQSEQRYRTYVENAPDAIFVLDRNANYVEVNQAACRMTGYTSAELTGMSLGELLTQEEKRAGMQRFGEVLSKGKVSGESAYRRKDGRTLYVTLDAVQLSQDRVLAFIKDVTESRMLQEQLRQSQKLESIGQLAGGIAHDFNNLLTGILGNAQLLELGLEENSELAPLVEQISLASGRAADLTKQLLGFARRGRIRTVEVNLHELVIEVTGLLSHSIDRKIEVRRELEAESPLVSGDPTQLQNVLLNLGVNARDAMPDGGTLTFATRNVELDSEYCRLRSGEIAPGSYVEVSVTDTGVGMAPEVVERIFEPFFTTKPHGEGTGLGLAGAYGSIRSHQGLIECYSRPREGTVMRLLLPMHSVQQRPAGSLPVTSYVYGRGRVMVVDDEEIVRNFAATALRNLGYEVALCRDGVEAIEYVRRHSGEVDIVVLDLIMPRLGGADTLRQLRQIEPDLDVLISSGFTKGEIVSECLEAGAVGFLSKPFQIAELSHQIALHLGTHPDAEAL
ncbi:MAG: response regulator [Phycisphaerae bacterium]